MADRESLKRNLEWYIDHQEELVKTYSGKVLLIKDEKLVKAFADMEGAYIEALKLFVPGTFTLQPCAPGPESYTVTIFSPQYCA